jgi:hypothetical protein
MVLTHLLLMLLYMEEVLGALRLGGNTEDYSPASGGYSRDARKACRAISACISVSLGHKILQPGNYAVHLWLCCIQCLMAFFYLSQVLI